MSDHSAMDRAPLWRDLRWRKMLRDAWVHRARTALVAAALAIGLVAAGALLDTWALTQRVTDETFHASNPVSATLHLDRADADLLAQVRTLPAIADARARRVVAATLQANGTSRRAMIFALDDFTRTTIGALRVESGTWPPRDGEVVIERSALAYSGATVGEPALISVGSSPPRALPVSGIVRDVSLAPGWMDNVVYLFATSKTLVQLGTPDGFDEVQIRVRDPRADREAVRRIARDVKALAERSGRHVADVDVPVPGEHMHAAQMNSLMMTQLAFGVLTLLVCAFLVVNLVTAMLAREVREIGVMKTLGGGNGAIAAISISFALLLGAVASTVALPLALFIGREYAVFKTEMLNFPLDGVATPVSIIVVQLLAGCLLPVAAAAWPVLRSCRMPVADALRDVGLASDVGRRRTSGFGLARPLLLSLNNAFRRRARLVLTLAALAAGGAVYLAAANLQAAVAASVDEIFDSENFDFALHFSKGLPADELASIAQASPGIARVETWAWTPTRRIAEDGVEGNRLRLVGLPPRSELFVPKVEAGRWLDDGDDHALVVSRAVLHDDVSMTPGAQVTLRINDDESRWTVVGVIPSGPEMVAYTTPPALAAARADGTANALVVTTVSRSLGAQLESIRELRARLEDAGARVAGSQRVAESRRIASDHLTMAVDFLGGMGWVMILVGGFGLASTLGLAVLERTREIGVLRAIGARHGDILQLVEVEGLVIGLLAWLAALPLSMPVSAVIGAAFGRMMFPVSTPLLPDAGALMRWLGLVVVIALFAGLWPARRAMRVPTATALAYE